MIGSILEEKIESSNDSKESSPARSQRKLKTESPRKPLVKPLSCVSEAGTMVSEAGLVLAFGFLGGGRSSWLSRGLIRL